MDGVEKLKDVLWMKDFDGIHPNTEHPQRASVEVKDGIVQVTEELFEQMMRDLGWVKMTESREYNDY